MVMSWRRRRNRLVPHADTRAVLELAKEEAVSMNHSFVGSGHLLVGLLRGPDGPAAHLLAAHADVDAARAELRDLVGAEEADEPGGDEVTREEDPTPPLPFSPHAREVLERAGREARSWRDAEIAPEHVLAGVLREEAGTASKMLDRLRVPRQVLREQVRENLRQPRR